MAGHDPGPSAPNPTVALVSGTPSVAPTRDTFLLFTALAQQDVWILSQCLLEEQGCTVFSSLGEEGTWLGYHGQAYQCARPPRQTLVVGSVSQPGKLNLPAKDGEPALLLLLDL